MTSVSETKLALAKWKSERHIKAGGGGGAKAAPDADEDTEDPIMKAEREFFEIIKKVSEATAVSAF